MVNQIPLWNFKIKHILYVQSAQGQKAEASLGFAGVVSVKATEFYCKENKKNPEVAFFLECWSK